MNLQFPSVFVSIGSNMGHLEANLLQAQLLIQSFEGIEIVKASAFYKTAAWGKKDQADFLNMVIELHTKLKPEELIIVLMEIEEKMGRKRNDHWGPRLIDLDILLFGNEIILTEGLTIPHPEMTNRNFVLIPLAEIASEFVHPTMQIKISELLELSKDNSSVNIILKQDSGNAR